MTDSPPAKVIGTIESTRTARRKEESARKFVNLSFPVRGNAELIGQLEEQLGNTVEVTFGQPQQPLLKQAADTEEVNATVDGQPARIRRTKVSNETKARLEAMQEAGKTNHVFISKVDDEFCGACGQASETGIHLVPTWMERYEHYLNDPESSGYQLPGNAADSATDDVTAGRAQQLTEEEAAFRESVDPTLSPTAQALIEESRRMATTEEEAQQQREAEASLAGRGR